MKKLCTAALALLIPLLIAPSAGAVFIADTYWGGTQVEVSGAPLLDSTADVIGGNFEVLGMDVTRSGGLITVVLSGPFFEVPPINSLGDLYISTTGWKQENTTSPPIYPRDRFTAGEGWNWYVSTQYGLLQPLKNFGAIQGTLGVALDAATGPVGGGPGRINQALTGGLDPNDPSYSATVSSDIPAGTLTYTFPDLWPTEDKLGLHWTMFCGNDVVELEVGQPVPEPGTMLLVGCGLIGLAVFRRKFKK